MQSLSDKESTTNTLKISLKVHEKHLVLCLICLFIYPALEFIPNVDDETYLKPTSLKKFLPYDVDNFWRYAEEIKLDENCSEITTWTVFKVCQCFFVKIQFYVLNLQEPIELSEHQIKRLWRFVPPGNYSSPGEPFFPPSTDPSILDRDFINYIHPYKANYTWNADLSYKPGKKV